MGPSEETQTSLATFARRTQSVHRRDQAREGHPTAHGCGQCGPVRRDDSVQDPPTTTTSVHRSHEDPSRRFPCRQ